MAQRLIFGSSSVLCYPIRLFVPDGRTDHTCSFPGFPQLGPPLAERAAVHRLKGNQANRSLLSGSLPKKTDDLSQLPLDPRPTALLKNAAFEENQHERRKIMGMDVFGNSGNYFRANIWSWRTIIYAMKLAGYDVPASWSYNEGDGLGSQNECDLLAEKLQIFLKSWDGNTLVLETKDIRVDQTGQFVDPGTPNSQSPYFTDREHLQEFVDFLKECEGFQIR